MSVMITLFRMTFFCILEQNLSPLAQDMLANPQLKKIGLLFKSEEKHYDIKVLRNFLCFLDLRQNLALNMRITPTARHPL